MRIVIVGFPYSGKTSLFCAISGIPRDHVKRTEENLAAVKVPEPRLDVLERMFRPKKRTEATMDFVDLPGSAEGESEHAGLTRHLPTLRQADALLAVVRAFASDAVPAHLGRVDPGADLRLLHEEMLLADLVICDGRVEKLEKALTKPSKERDQQKHELALLQRCRECLEKEKPLREIVQPGEEERMLRSFGFLTQKPLTVAVNVAESDIGLESQAVDAGAARAAHAAQVIPVCAALEAELILLDPAERPEMMAGYGIKALARDRIIRACFDALGLITFLTAGEEEVRSWATPAGTTAVEAAGKIHTDLARGFIRAETIAFDELASAGSMREARAAGKLRQEPRGYVVQDGDVVYIKFNV